MTPGFWWKIHLNTMTSTIVEVINTPAGLKVRNIGVTGLQLAAEEPTDGGYYYERISPPPLAAVYDYQHGRAAYSVRASELKAMSLAELVERARLIGVKKEYKTPGMLRRAILREEGFKAREELADV